MHSALVRKHIVECAFLSFGQSSQLEFLKNPNKGSKNCKVGNFCEKLSRF